MIYIWLVLLAVVYVVVAIVVGKVCAVNNRWETSVDDVAPPGGGGSRPEGAGSEELPETGTPPAEGGEPLSLKTVAAREER